MAQSTANPAPATTILDVARRSATFTPAELAEFDERCAAWPGDSAVVAYEVAESLTLFGVPTARAYGMCRAHQLALGERVPAVATCGHCFEPVEYADAPDATAFERRHGLTRDFRHLSTGEVVCTPTHGFARPTLAAPTALIGA